MREFDQVLGASSPNQRNRYATSSISCVPTIEPERPHFPLADRLSSDPERRTLELIYQLRRYLRFARDANWIETIRGLIKLDEVAVPELIVELDHADDPGLLESLGLILCEINDPRSVPALIRAVDRPRRWRDQHWRGVRAENDKLIEAFWKSDELWKSPIRCRTSCGNTCLLYTSPSPRDQRGSRMPSSA